MKLIPPAYVKPYVRRQKNDRSAPHNWVSAGLTEPIWVEHAAWQCVPLRCHVFGNIAVDCDRRRSAIERAKLFAGVAQCESPA